MPPPGWGQGNAFGSGAECNERFRADARRAALAHEARQCARDDVRETEIIKLITASGLERSRRSTASEEVRAAMKCCRLGVDWNLDVSIGKCTYCNVERWLTDPGFQGPALGEITKAWFEGVLQDLKYCASGWVPVQ